jgi:hypothetical protein
MQRLCQAIRTGKYGGFESANIDGSRNILSAQIFLLLGGFDFGNWHSWERWECNAKGVTKTIA